MEPIAAIATAQGAGGVAIVRISGDDSLGIARAMFSRKGEFKPNVLYAGTIDCGDFSDYGFCVYFRAPRSFTGEDCVEFHSHGGTEIPRGVLKRAIALGARLAERGEFTKRAFLNGKLSLSAAEGMADMINAQSFSQVRAGFLLYGEKLTAEAAKSQAVLKECLAAVDADVDYPEEELSTQTREKTAEKLGEVLVSVSALLNQYSAGKKIKSGVNVAICGRPNAGKSSLLNALVGYDRAIVSPVAGTTRDIVEGTLELGGVLFRLIDTAGIRESADEIEREGVRRAENAVKSADVTLFLAEEGDNPPPISQGAALITVGAKCDLARKEGCDVCVSSKTGEGLEKLKELLYERGFGAENDGAFILEERHYAALKAASQALKDASDAIYRGEPAEVYAEDMKRAYVELGVLSGETATEEIINAIFEKFCVGK